MNGSPDNLKLGRSSVVADNIPDAVQWHEGMLLTPQHFQQADARHEALLQYAALAISPYGWGVRRLVVDTKLLPAGTFRVLDLEAVMPDGLVVLHPLNAQQDLELDLTPHIEQMRQGDVTIHLAVPAKSSSGGRGGMVRYEAYEGSPVVDENTGEGDLRIPRLRPHLVLLAMDTPPPKYAGLPLAKLRFRDEAVTLTDFVPPAMAVPLDSPIGRLCSQLVQRIREKAMQLSDQVRAPSSIEGMPLVLESKQRIQSLVGGLPLFEAVLGTGLSHPYPLYLALCSLAGTMAALGRSLVPPALKPYEHADPLSTFRPVLEFAAQMIREGISETYSTFPFQFGAGVFSRLFEGEWVGRRLVLGMRTPTGISEREMMNWAEQCLIGSASTIESLRDKRILGAGREFIERDGDLVPVRGVVLFVLQFDAEFILPGEPLCVFNPGEQGLNFRPLELVLYVRNG